MALDINSTLSALVPLADGVGWIMNSLKILVGGMFGLYVIMIFLRWKEFKELKEMVNETKKMHMELSQMHKEFQSTIQSHKKK